MNKSNSKSQESITVRKFPGNFAHIIPNRIIGDSKLGSHFMNAMSMLFPDGEQFFIDNVKRFESFADPALKKRIKAFAGQEAMHGNAHTNWNQNLRDKGYDTDKIQRNLDFLLNSFDKFWHRFNDKLGLSFTVALEHITATQSAWFLDHPEIFEGFEETIQDITLWHSCEEIEHRSVAFDLLKQVDDSYSLRIFGHLLANLFLYTLMYTGAYELYRQEKGIGLRTFIQDVASTRPIMNDFMRIGWLSFISYFKPDFHPDDDKEAMAKAQAMIDRLNRTWAERKANAN